MCRSPYSFLSLSLSLISPSPPRRHTPEVIEHAQSLSHINTACLSKKALWVGYYRVSPHISLCLSSLVHSVQSVSQSGSIRSLEFYAHEPPQSDPQTICIRRNHTSWSWSSSCTSSSCSSCDHHHTISNDLNLPILHQFWFSIRIKSNQSSQIGRQNFNRSILTFRRECFDWFSFIFVFRRQLARQVLQIM